MRLVACVLVAGIAVAPAAMGGDLLEMWVARCDGPGEETYAGDEASGIAVDDSGNVYVTGTTIGVHTGGDYTTLKYDRWGTRIWVVTYDGPGHGWDHATALARCPGGGIYVTGMSEGVSWHSYDFATIKYSCDGQEEWVARYDRSIDRAYAIAVDDTGNVYVSGSTGLTFQSDYATVKYDPEGHQVWVARYDSPGQGDDWGYSVALGPDGSVYVAGTSDGFGTWNDIVTVKYDPAGNEQWVARYDGPSHRDDSGGLTGVDTTGAAYVIGSSLGIDTGEDWVTIKYTDTGDTAWVSRYTSPGARADRPGGGLVIADGGGVVVTGMATFDYTLRDFVTLRYDAEGGEVWVATYNGPADAGDAAGLIAVDSSGNIIISGASVGIGTESDWATIKYSPAGEEIAVARYDGPGSETDMPRAIAVDEEGDIHVAGFSTTAGIDSDMTAIKYAFVTGVPEIPSAAVRSLSCRCSPNPTTGGTRILLQTPRELAPGQLTVHNVSGQLVRRLHHGWLSGESSILWDGTGEDGRPVSSGSYFICLWVQGAMETCRVVLVR